MTDEAPAYEIRELDTTQHGERELVVEASCKARWPACQSMKASGRCECRVRCVAWRHWREIHMPEVLRYVDSGRTFVAVKPGGGQSVVLGFVVALEDEVRMLYVKLRFRGYGLGEALLRACGT